MKNRMSFICFKRYARITFIDESFMGFMNLGM